MKLLISFFSSLILLALGLTDFVMSEASEVIIQSEESKTIEDKPVFNKIKWQSYKDKDIWWMKQSHLGSNAAPKDWENLAIVIDKTQEPYTARYYQIESGELNPDIEPQMQKAVPFRVPCFMCHTNGLRAIRPEPSVALSIQDSLKLAYWNFKIKSYGRVVLHPDHMKPAAKEWTIRWESSYMNDPLKVATCVLCHKNSGLLARGELKRQHIPAIQFMIKSEHMPPLGIPLSDKEKLELKYFVNGF